jgi:hypothetical protein
MILSGDIALVWVEKLIAIAVALQTLELLALRKTISDDGVWSWSVLKKDFTFFPKPFRTVFDWLLRYPHFIFLLLARLGCSLALLALPYPGVVVFLLFSTILISWRWRGSVNGGSDFMTLMILMALGAAVVFKSNPRVVAGCLWYISLQTCTSYFIAGLVKLKRPNWRSGRAMKGFLCATIYQPSAPLLSIANRPLPRVIGSWLVMAFEFFFPLALSGPHACLGFIGAAAAFHFLALPGSVWVKTEPAAMEKNRDAIFFKISESASVGFDDLDLGVEPFGRRVRDAVTTVG